MNKKLKSALKITFFFAVGISLFYLAYRGQDFSVLWQAVKETRWEWMVLYVVLALAGHYSRALRWGMLIEPLGYMPKSVNLFSSIMIMYLSNMAVPRSGEFLRCAITSRYEGIPFSKSFGTVITERIVDMLVFFVLTVVVVFFSGGIISGFMEQNPGISERLEALREYVPVFVVFGLVFMTVGILAVYYAVKKNLLGLGEKVRRILSGMRDGVMTVLKMKRKFMFFFHTFFINLMYFLEVYLPFKAFSFTENLTLNDALNVFVLGNYGVLIPSPGGMGTWHFIVIGLLSVLGVDKDPGGRAYAFVTHGVQDIVFLTVGFLMLLLLPVLNKNYKIKNEN